MAVNTVNMVITTAVDTTSNTDTGKLRIPLYFFSFIMPSC